MTKYCRICGNELYPEEEFEGVCENCKLAKDNEDLDEEESYDPGIV